MVRAMVLAMKKLLSYILWPLLLTVGLFFTALGFGAGYHPVLVLAVIYVVMALVVFLFERIMPHNPDWNVDDGQMANDFAHTIVGTIITPRIMDGVILAVLSAPQLWLACLGDAGIWPTHWPLAAQIVLAIVVADFGDYWAHRLSHTVPFLWRFHALHHNPPRLYFFNTGRFHPVDMIESIVMIAPILILLGASPEIMMWQIAVTNYIGLLSHCNIEMRFGFLNYLFNTPGVHRWHHSALPAEADNNYGGNTMLWDLLFRTHLNPNRPPPTELGIKALLPDTIIGQLFAPLHFNELEAKGEATRQAKLNDLEMETD